MIIGSKSRRFQQSSKARTKDADAAPRSESLQRIHEALLKEYDALRQEILLHLELEDRTISYLLLLVGGVLAAVQAFQNQALGIIGIFNQHPIIYIALALLSFLFPLVFLEQTLFMATLGSYLDLVLTPKIDQISKLESDQGGSSRRFLQIDSEYFQPEFEGVMKWEAFRPRKQFRGAVPIFGTLAIFKRLFTCIPTALFAMAFFFTKPDPPSWTIFEIVLLLLGAYLALVWLIGSLMGAGLFTNIIDRGRFAVRHFPKD